MKILASDLQRFYDAVGAKLQCPVCNHDGWTIVDASENVSWAFVGAPDDGQMKREFTNLPVFALVCNRCFSTRTHATKPILVWLQANPATEPPSPQETKTGG